MGSSQIELRPDSTWYSIAKRTHHTCVGMSQNPKTRISHTIYQSLEQQG